MELFSDPMPLTDEEKAKRQTILDKMSGDYAGLLIAYTLVQYAINIEMKKDIAFGMKILNEFEKARDELKEATLEYRKVFSDQEIEESSQRTGFFKNIFSQVSDPALELSNKYFFLPPRPPGPEYACSDEKCREAALALARQYFSDLYGTKA